MTAALKDNGQKTKRYQDIKILGLEYTSDALRSHSRSEFGGVPKEVLKPQWDSRPLR
jgi:hypothetical protein